MKKDKYSKLFLEELTSVPIVSAACGKLGVSRNTVYRWRKEDSVFSVAMDEALEVGTHSINDLAESKLIGNIKKGDMRAIQYWLDNNKQNYMKPRTKDLRELRKWQKQYPDGEDTIKHIILIDK